MRDLLVLKASVFVDAALLHCCYCSVVIDVFCCRLPVFAIYMVNVSRKPWLYSVCESLLSPPCLSVLDIAGLWREAETVVVGYHCRKIRISLNP